MKTAAGILELPVEEEMIDRLALFSTAAAGGFCSFYFVEVVIFWELWRAKGFELV